MWIVKESEEKSLACKIFKFACWFWEKTNCFEMIKVWYTRGRDNVKSLQVSRKIFRVLNSKSSVFSRHTDACRKGVVVVNPGWQYYLSIDRTCYITIILSISLCLCGAPRNVKFTFFLNSSDPWGCDIETDVHLLLYLHITRHFFWASLPSTW